MSETKDKIHYRKAFNSPYLSSADIVEPTVLTIKCVRLEPDQTKKTKDLFNTAYFVEKEIRQGEKLKPMILNATNSRTMKELTESPFIDDWVDVPVTVYIDSNVRFGRDTVEGLRISTDRARTAKPILTPDSTEWQKAVDAVGRDGSAECITSRRTVSPAHLKLLLESAGVA